MAAILAAGVALPRHRLDRTSVGGGGGTTAVAAHDQDATALGVEAARRAMAAAGDVAISSLLFATTTPPYADRTNATAIHQALDLPSDVAAFDMVGSVRSSIGALRAAFDAAEAGRTTLVVAADVRCGLPGSHDERELGDAGAALLIGPGAGPALAELVGLGAATREFLDRWRVPGEPTSRIWEERFGEREYGPLAAAALEVAVGAAGLALAEVDEVLISGLHTRAVASVRRQLGVAEGAVDLAVTASVGMTGSAHPLLLIAAALETAATGDVIALLNLVDGADCLVLRAAAGIEGLHAAPTVAEQLWGRSVDRHDVLVWRGLLRREPPRRPDPERPAAPPSNRNAAWKFGLVASRCTACGARHLPPDRVCRQCHRVDEMEREPLAGVEGTIATFTVDHLAFTVAPPVVAAIVDLDGGGRLQCELADADPARIAVGDRVELTFRRIHTTADGVHNYFWKARPLMEVH